MNMRRFKYILFAISSMIVAASCSQVSESDNTQELINEEREANKRAQEYENNKMFDGTQRDYEVRRIPQRKETNKPDDD